MPILINPILKTQTQNHSTPHRRRHNHHYTHPKMTHALSPPFSTTPSFIPTRFTTLPPLTRHHHNLSLTPRATQKPYTPPRAPLTRPPYIPNHIPDPTYIRIFDTTLRDGEQSPGASLSPPQKLEIARNLARLGVDVIEAGFPAASNSDFDAVKAIAIEVGRDGIEGLGHVPVICGLARCSEGDIRKAWEAVSEARLPRVHTFIATSDVHLEYKLGMSREEVVARAKGMVRFAMELGCVDVEFSPEDAGRTDKEFLYHILGEVIKAGATTLNIPDTVGYTVPDEFGKLIADIKANTPGIENVIISTHCQNDLGLSTANTIAGALAGARQLEVTINGIGERAGNASLEEVVMTLKCRGKDLGGLYTGIDTVHIIKTSKMVAEHTGLLVQPHKAIVGANAFKHESGIHQHGMLKHKGTYEIMSPEDIGLQRADESGLVLGKLSGRHALQKRLEQMGHFFEGKELDDIFLRFKAVAEKKKHVVDEDIEALVVDELFQPEAVWSLGDIQVTTGTLGLSTATVKLVDADGVEHVACSVGTGPVDSAYKAIDLVVKVPVTLVEYSMTAVTEGIDAIATTKVLLRGDSSFSSTHASTGEKIQRTFSGSGSEMDIVVSSVRAYLSALNKMLGFKKRKSHSSPAYAYASSSP